MSALEKLQNIQEKNKSLICLGLDLDPKRMPAEHSKSIKGMYEFAMQIIEATSDLVCAYKPNMAFYESRGPEGLSLLKSINSRIPDEISIIVDGKRGDIGNTASHYAESLYDIYRADYVTLNPYMGYDTIRPFLEFKDKGVFILCLTSNTGSKDFQLMDVNGKPLYQVVAEKVDYWNKEDNCGLVVGATAPEQLKDIRGISGKMPLLIPGVGAQGGSLEKAVIYGTDNFTKTATINVSRSVLYASTGDDFAQCAREELIKLNDTVNKIRSGEISIPDDEVPVDVDENREDTSTTVSFAQPETQQQPTSSPEQPTPVEPVKTETVQSKTNPVPSGIPTQPEQPPTVEQEEKVETTTEQPTQVQADKPEEVKPETTEQETPVEPTPKPALEPTHEPKRYNFDPPQDSQQEEEKKPEETPQQSQPLTPPPLPTPPPIPQAQKKPEDQKEETKSEPAKPEEEKSEPAKPTMPKPPPPLPKPPPVLPPRPDLIKKRQEEDQRRREQQNRQGSQHDRNRDQNRSDNRNVNRNNNREFGGRNNRTNHNNNFKGGKDGNWSKNN